jgi:4-hydroxy-tetrahydrodipicolinate synthase
MSVETMTRLSELKNISGVKDATGDLKRVDQTIKSIGKNFIQLTGEDNNVFEFNKRGGVGCISVTANVAPKLCSEFQVSSTSKDLNLQKRAKDINDLLTPLHKALFIESNPSPVKYAASLLKLCNQDVRLPLVKIMDSTKIKVEEALKYAKLL